MNDRSLLAGEMSVGCGVLLAAAVLVVFILGLVIGINLR
jgi:hypothetical protein